MNYKRKDNSKMGRLRTRILELLGDPSERPPGRRGMTIHELMPRVDNAEMLRAALMQLQESFDVTARAELVVVLPSAVESETVRGLRLEFILTNRDQQLVWAENRRERIRLKLAGRGDV